ncbi:hypothetical protein ABZ470_40710 [Streptosporangium sp. NPDC020072]|uniref:hypothetical protein n=1 Tax=Streptosporangium sp. NPDC020072 TaxID=3154788 RepID=UPI00343EAC73
MHLIAVRWGLTDNARFSRAFRAAYGLSPAEYRSSADPGETLACRWTVRGSPAV